MFIQFDSTQFEQAIRQGQAAGLFRVHVCGTAENVYEMPICNARVRGHNVHADLRIYSSISPHDSSRAYGQDAIKFVVFYRASGHEKPFGSLKKVNRNTSATTDMVQARKGLFQKVLNEIEIVKRLTISGMGEACPRCGNIMVPKWNVTRKRWWLGCSKWSETRCNGSRSVERCTLTFD